jgi:endo-1,4-beta-xylanase
MNKIPFPLRLDRGEGQGEVSKLPCLEGLASVYLKFKQLKVPAELHIYAGTGHGFGLRTNNTRPAGKWIERFEEWLEGSGFLKKP